MATIAAIFVSMRPRQWVKNLAVFAPLLFAQKMLETPSLLRTAGAFAVFCILSGTVYLVNDLTDAERDRRHPVKSRRPVASGRLGKPQAVAAAFLLIPAGLAASLAIDVTLLYCACAYLAINLLYTFRLKDVLILDLFSIASGFIIRVAAGGLVIHVPLSNWLLICTTLLSLFLALAKRRHELVLLEEDSANHREVLKEYTPYLLDQMISVVTASTVIAYSLYTLSAETMAKLGTDKLIFTVPFVLYGIFRYLYLMHNKREGGSPENTLLADRPLLYACMLWACTAIIVLYFR
jgi:4-hydroxybenzoate polyprenyltransferase